MNRPKLGQYGPARASGCAPLGDREKVRFESVAHLAPLLDELAEKTGGGFAVTSGGSTIFTTHGVGERVMVAEDGAIELEVGGRRAYLRFLRRDMAPPPAMARMATLGEVTAGAAHDINNLLSGIIGYIDMLQGVQVRGQEYPAETFAGTLAEMERHAHTIARICGRMQRFGVQKSEVVPVEL